MSRARYLTDGGTGGGGGTIEVGPEFGDPAPQVIVAPSIPLYELEYAVLTVVAAASVPMIEAETSLSQESFIVLGFERTYTVGANAVAEEAIVGDGWANDANATGLTDGTNAHMDGSGAGDLGACEGRLVLDYANVDADRDDAEVIDTVTLRFYGQTGGTLLNNGDLRLQWRRASADPWTTLETFTGDENFSGVGTRREHVVTTSIRDWADIDTLQAGVFGAIDAAEALIDYDIDAVELVITSHRASVDFDPRSISGLQLWLDADNLNTTRQTNADTTAARTNGDTVGRWKDLSTNAHNIDQATAADRPILTLNGQNGRPVVQNFISDRLLKTITGTTTDYTVVSVTKSVIGGLHPSFISVENVFEFNTAKRISIEPGGNRVRFRNNANTADVIISWTAADLAIVVVAGNSSGVEVFVNGVSVGTAADPTQGRFTAFDFINNGMMLEYAVYFSVISTADRRRLERYLAVKWGVSLA